MRILSLLVLLLTLPAMAQADLIRGGVSAGGVELGQTLSQVRQSLGKPERIQASPTDKEAGMHYYPSQGLAILFSNEQKVLGVTVTSPKYRTAEQLSVGSSRTDVEQKYGEGLQRGNNNLSYPDRGLAFSFQDGKVAQIYVVKKEEDRPLLGDRLLVPGQRAGDLRLGQADTRVKQEWGKPDSDKPMKQGSTTRVVSYKDEGVRLVTQGGRIDGILITTGDFITREGVKVGSTTSEVQRALGTGFTRKGPGMFYDSRGIGFMLGNDKVIEVQILYPRQPKTAPDGG